MTELKAWETIVAKQVIPEKTTGTNYYVNSDGDLIAIDTKREDYIAHRKVKRAERLQKKRAKDNAKLDAKAARLAKKEAAKQLKIQKYEERIKKLQKQ